MRVFIAVEFEKEMKEHLLEAQKKVAEKSSGGNFTAENNFHLTVRFIGEVDDEDLNSLIVAMEESASRNKSFNLRLSHLGFFPKGNKSVVWAGIDKSDSLIRLFNNLEKNLTKQGFPRERTGLSPHITLGRDVVLRPRFDDVKAEVPLGDKVINVSKISLMESKRIGGKMVYRPIFVSNLK